MKTKKIIAGAVLAIVTVPGIIGMMRAGSVFMNITETDFTKSLKKKIEWFNGQFPQDRVYLQFDKPFYEPGETIWFSAYVRDAATLKPSLKSDIVHVELINPKGSVEKHIKLIAKNGTASGDFIIGDDQPGGMYKVKAYTRWQKNEGDSIYFEKEIQVQEVILPNLKMKMEFQRKAFGSGDEVVAKVELNTNENKPLANHTSKYVVNLEGKKIGEGNVSTDNEGIAFVKFRLPENLKSADGLLNVLVDYQGSTESISRSIPILLNQIKFTLYPEGGDLVNNLESRVAFRAVNEFGKPADVEGVVTTKEGGQVIPFKSYHNGMGAFSIKPESGNKYFVKITQPKGIKELFELPEALPRGYVLNVDPSTNTYQTMLTINTTETEELSIVGQVRGKVYYASAIKAVAGKNQVSVPSYNFPVGVAQFTLFDSRGIERAERLVFMNKGKQLNISVYTDKEKYLPREKVKMTILVRDDRGIPMPASLSLSVTNDQLLSFADDKSGNILSKLLLEQDLKEKVEEPAFYFNPKEEKANTALDYLLMTSGWRRFTWKQVINEEAPAITHQGERAVIAGIVMDYYNNKPVANAEIKIDNSFSVQTDEKGKFWFRNVDLSKPVTLMYNGNEFTAQNQVVYDYNNNLILYLYDNRNRYVESALASGVYRNDLVPMAAPAAKDGAVYQWNFGDGNKKKTRVAAFGGNDKPMVKAAGDVNRNRKMDVKPKEDADARQEVAAVEPAKRLAAEKNQVRLVEAEADDERIVQFFNAGLQAKAQPQQSLYYRSREFAGPVYDTKEEVKERTDFRSTIYWNGTIETDRTGRKMIEFYNSDDISSFRATVEGISTDGGIGRSEKTYFTQLPFTMSVKVPVEVATEDVVSMPLTLKNNTTAPLGGFLTVTSPDGLKSISKIEDEQILMPGEAKVIYLDYRVLSKTGESNFSVSFKACGLSDAFSQKIKTVAKGFPAGVSFSGNKPEETFRLDISSPVQGSLQATFTAYPNVVNDLMKGVEGILREPYGCFEQTSTSSYPNAMVMDYLKTTGSEDQKLLASAEKLLDKGYKRLTSFETKDKGYEWFGAAPGHEALTAYGLMQFNDMKKVYGDVDQGMIDRTAKWLMSRRDGNGGFKRNSRALDSYGRASEEITNAYIVWALAEAGYTDIMKETDAAYDKAVSSKDPYQLALLANAMYELKDVKRGDKAMELLYTAQEKDGSWNGKSHSITYSSGQSLRIETTSLSILAILKAPVKKGDALVKGVESIVKSRSGSGVFGSTQGTILALKALTEYAKFSKRASEDGSVEIYVDGKKVGEKKYKAGDKDGIVIDGLEKFLSGGRHEVKVKYPGVKNPLPYSLAVNWSTTLPNSSKECKVEMNTKLSGKSVKVGETMRLTATLTNTTAEGLPSTMAIIGIPAGFTAQPWQLKELQEKKIVDYYEIIGNNIAVYYRQMAPSEVKEINLDLKAEIPGEYDAPASSAYLYYTNEFKCWRGLERVTVRK